MYTEQVDVNNISTNNNILFPVYGGILDKNCLCRTITKIYIQPIDFIYGPIYDEINKYELYNKNFDNYVIHDNYFIHKLISYEGWAEGYYNGVKKDVFMFNQTKMSLYDEFNKTQLINQLLNVSEIEKQFIFSYLIDRKKQEYIGCVIEWILNSYHKNVDMNTLFKSFEYLSTFKSKKVKDFFEEYMNNIYWDNSEIILIILDYLNEKE